MKRLHVHVAVEDLSRSVGFYSTLFAAEPTVLKPDYAKWMLDDPRVNFAISQRGGAPGIEHLGIQVETPEELREVYGRLRAADGPVLEEGETVCCYHRSEKSWISDPQGVSWETFLTSGESTVYRAGPEAADPARASAICCAPPPAGVACCAERVAPASALPAPTCCDTVESARV
ncbi:catechol 2,3-dioxygenase-like lactoylglutathione lyase family enzyme [Constrictibacter sp. MBR-5]|jgi:catechol 2,3-dioxygenase-like lactoylglutathione lyase family enzyme|uniref:ArsI/CadI family heavy metal resistance metalloenzyme n=1 Tax=Constrictibacter sp. MBR-5 TaxID=3156467 RepID=UPI003395D494